MNWLLRLLPFAAKALDARRASRRELVMRVAFLEEQHEQQQELVAYWRTRAEKLIDSALVRANAAHEPMMREPKIDQRTANPFGGMSVSEIDTTRKAAS
jgi:hypothetical protein